MAADRQKSFIMYDEYAQHFSLLSDEELGALMRAVYSYRQNGEVAELPDKAAMAFSFIRVRLDEDSRRYEETCEKNRQNGARGGRKKSEDVPEKSERFSEKPKRTDRFSKETEKTERFFEKPKKPDTDTNTDTDSDTNFDTDTENQNSIADAIDYRAVVEKYEQKCPSLPAVKILSDKRKRAIKKLLDNGVDLDALFENAENSDFLSGRNGKWGGCNFDWLMNYNNALKVLEGAYRNTKNKASPLAVYDSGRYDYDEIEELARRKLKKMISKDEDGAQVRNTG